MRELKIVTESYPPHGHGTRPSFAASTSTISRSLAWRTITRCDFSSKGRGGEILGGLLGDIWGGWLHVGSLWVSESLRGRGYGAELMARAHQYALEKSCTHAHLQTGSYEARPLYEKLGYNVYAELKNHPDPRRIAATSSSSASTRTMCGPLHVKDLAIVNASVCIRRMRMRWSGRASPRMPTRRSAHRTGMVAIQLFPARLARAKSLAARWEISGTTGCTSRIYGWIARCAAMGTRSKLMATAEEHAIAKGCGNAFLDTFSFQARPLYEKLGLSRLRRGGGSSEGA